MARDAPDAAPEKHCRKLCFSAMPNLFNLTGTSPKDIAQRTWAEICAVDVFGRSAQLAYCFFGSVQESVSQPEFTGILILAKSGYTRQHARDRLDQGFRVAGVSGLPTGNQRRRQDTEAVGAA